MSHCEGGKVAKGRRDEELWVICDWLLGKRKKKPPLSGERRRFDCALNPSNQSLAVAHDDTAHADIVAELLKGGFLQP
jgi:hypothetical protein